MGLGEAGDRRQAIGGSDGYQEVTLISFTASDCPTPNAHRLPPTAHELKPTLRVTVLTGGASAERDVALASARQVVPALRLAGHHVVVVDTATGFVPESREADHLLGTVGTTPPSVADLQARERSFLLTSLGALPEVREADVVFLALHGGRGEDCKNAAEHV